MKKTHSRWILLIASSLALLGIVACTKENTGGQKLDIYLTDGPADFDAVNIQIVSVEVKVDTSCTHGPDDHFGDNDGHQDDHMSNHDEYGVWQTLQFTPGIYDVLSLRNGIDSLIATTVVTGTVRKIRFSLGIANTVVVNGVSYPLVIQNPTGNYLYVSLNDRHRENGPRGNLSVWVDFDLGRSIVLINGQYFLRPIMRPFCDANFGKIEGRILPAAAQAVVKVYNSTDTLSAIPNPDGFFKVRGLTQGAYTIFIDATAPYRDTTLNNITIATGRDTRIGTITLTQ